MKTILLKSVQNSFCIYLTHTELTGHALNIRQNAVAISQSISNPYFLHFLQRPDISTQNSKEVWGFISNFFYYQACLQQTEV